MVSTASARRGTRQSAKPVTAGPIRSSMPAAQPTEQSEPREAPSCVHHWLLAEPAAGAIPGRCKRCGVERLFPASPEGAERFDDYRELTQTESYYSGRRTDRAE